MSIVAFIFAYAVAGLGIGVWIRWNYERRGLLGEAESTSGSRAVYWILLWPCAILECLVDTQSDRPLRARFWTAVAVDA